MEYAVLGFVAYALGYFTGKLREKARHEKIERDKQPMKLKEDG